ncbi:hypothetical protein A9Q90_05500 [Gammaproteobacteria bacterium 54_18_T64]|nr:hypothetical protein A9Q90_05500 [Gammaproteobacteria bacterium 54_18_T64]
MNELVVHIPEIAIGVTGSLIAGYLTAVFQFRKRYKQQYETALALFYLEIGKAIDEANDELAVVNSNNRTIKSNARAVVAIRNSFRGSFYNLAAILNSELDRLEEEIVRLEENPDDLEQYEKIRETLTVLKKTWPGKKPLIETELRSLLAKLGFREI